MQLSRLNKWCLYSFLTLVWPCWATAAVINYFGSEKNSVLLYSDASKAAMARISSLALQNPHVHDVKGLVEFLVKHMDQVRQDAKWYRDRIDAFISEQKKQNNKLNPQARSTQTPEKINSEFQDRMRLEVKNKYGSLKSVNKNTEALSGFISDQFTKRTLGYIESDYLKKNASGDSLRLTIYARKIAQKIAAFEAKRADWILGQHLYPKSPVGLKEPQLDDLQRAIDHFWEDALTFAEWIAQD